jgi:hypothetical protein
MRNWRTEQIKPVASLQEFFRDSVHDAMHRNGVHADDHTAYYVVNLLTLFARSEALFDTTEGGPELKPVAKILAEALDSRHSGERNFALQRVGDVSLFVAGFLGEGLARKLVDVDYYVYMGGAAYGTLSETVRGSLRGEVFGAVFAELAAKFQEFVDVLADIREDAKPSHADVLRLYETWLSTGSRRAERVLRSLGIEPNRTVDRNARH